MLPSLPHALGVSLNVSHILKILIVLLFIDVLSVSSRAEQTHSVMSSSHDGHVTSTTASPDGHMHTCPHGHKKEPPTGTRSTSKKIIIQNFINFLILSSN